ncbi:MAG: RagB/SusD family nutrient uptake outer membrane protein [Prevotella sp.]|nr:RagB/SusD family nutrient uptake outer membrane protein [Prevotella sp.]
MTPTLHKKLITCLLCCNIVAALTSCNDYLDELPDNRMELSTVEKVQKLLVSAYPANAPIFVAEYSSDNVDNYGDQNPNTSRFVDQIYHWRDITEAANEGTENFWAASYAAIASANLALQALDELSASDGTSLTTASRQEARAEALLCRAYCHFLLVNVFCQAYNSQTSDTDLGIVYMTAPADELDTNPSRSTVADVYRQIDRDLQEALPLVGSDYSVPKYHFNQKAAYAFATRFYLYYEQWDKAIDYATRCLGTAPEAMLRDWSYMATMTQTYAALTQHYIDATLNANLLLLTAYSSMGLVFGPYNYLSRYAHGKYLATHEDGEAQNIWGSAPYYQGMHTFAATNLDKTIFYKLPYLFEYYDAVAGTGYSRTVYPAFTADECLLNRAEALVLTNQYDAAARDLTTWMQNIVQTDLTLTPQLIVNFYNSADYSYSDSLGIASTIKKHLHPRCDIGQEGGTREAMLQCVLGFRRIETLQTGLRWYDVKRYGIEIIRRVINADGAPERRTDILTVSDPRRALQIPLKARTAGVAPNPR